MIYHLNQGTLESALRGLLIKNREHKNKPGLSWADASLFHFLHDHKLSPGRCNPKVELLYLTLPIMARCTKDIMVFER